MEQILLVDDDKALGVLLTQYLKQFQFNLTHATTPTESLRLLKNSDFKAIILDVMLPEMDGFALFPLIRKITSTPVIMLTARGELTDKVIGLEMGIDDYLAKPFEPRELAARIKALIRRSHNSQLKSVPIIKSTGGLELDTATQVARLNGSSLNLSSHEFHLLKFFMQNAGTVLSRDRLLDEMRGIDWESYNRSIDVAVSRLRQKLGDSAKNPKFLRTVWGDGYCFIAPLEGEL